MVNEIIMNLEKIGYGILLLLGVYIANMGLGAWRNVKMDGCKFDWHKILDSAVKFVVLGSSLALLVTVVTAIPYYSTYVGIAIKAETAEVLDSMIIIGGFLTATIRYAKDALSKLSDIFGNS